MDTAKTLWQAAASHCANTTALKHFDQLLFSWAVGQSEVFPESLADALRIKPVSVIRLSNQVRAEIQQCSHQSRNLFPLNRSYISTMNRFASSDIGPAWAGAEPESWINHDVLEGAAHLGFLVDSWIGHSVVAQAGASDQVAHVDVVGIGESRQHRARACPARPRTGRKC